METIDVPSALRERRIWLTWSEEWTPGAKKPKKVPYYAGGGRRRGEQGTPTDRAKLVTFEEAAAAANAQGRTGVGIALLPGGGVVALDFDDMAGRLDEFAKEVIRSTYTERSPSGKGMRALFLGEAEDAKSFASSQSYGLEVFASSGFVTVTGHVTPGCVKHGRTDTVSPIDAELLGHVRARVASARRAHLEEKFGKRAVERFQSRPIDPDVLAGGDWGIEARRVNLTLEQAREALIALGNPDLPYEGGLGEPTWLGVGMALHHQFEGSGEALTLWEEWSARSAKDVPGECARKWESFGQYGGGDVLTGAAIIRWARDLGGWSVNASSAREIEAAAHPSGFEDVSEPGESSSPPASRFRVWPVDELAAREPPRWLIRGVLPQGDIGLLYGASGAGKSFVAMDLALALARGGEWRGAPIERARPVVYIAAEGAGGMTLRARALAEYHLGGPEALAALPLGVIAAAPDLLMTEDCKDVVKAVRRWCRQWDQLPGLIVVDTFAQATPGANENSGEDMGRALRHCRAISKAAGDALVLLVHHAGKDASRGARGWSGLRAAADCEIRVARDPGEGSVGVIEVTKQKDGRDGDRFGFSLHTVNLGLDEAGYELTSCVVKPEEAPLQAAAGRQAPRRRVGEMQQLILDILEMSGPTDRENLLEMVRKEHPTTRQRNLNRSIDTLVEAGLATESEGRIALFSKNSDFFEEEKI